MHSNIILQNLLGVKSMPVAIKNTVITKNDEIIVEVSISKRKRFYCSKCGKKGKYRDTLPTNRLWRSLDLGFHKTYIKYRTIRVNCKNCGIVVASVPWARYNSRFTYDFETTITWLVLYSTHKAVSEQMRIDWSSVGNIVTRTYKDLEKDMPSRLDGLVNIGIDETSHRKGHKYMTIVVNHDNNTIVWAKNGYGKEGVSQFFNELTEEQKSSIKYISADGAKYIAESALENCPKAKRCMDPFHAVGWVVDSLDELRRNQWNEIRNTIPKDSKKRKVGRPKKGDEKPDTSAADKIKGSRYALGKNPENLTETQKIKLDEIERENPVLYKGWLLKEQFRDTFKFTKVVPARKHLKQWVKDVRNCGIELFEKLAEKIERHFEAIMNTIRSNVSNARVESMNTRIKVTLRMAYGFRNIDNMISLIMLRLGGAKPVLPGRV